MTPEFLESLKPFGVSGLALVVLYFSFRQIGFDPIKVSQKHGVWIALAFIIVIGTVVAFSIWIFRDDSVRKDSYILEGSRLSTLFAMNAEDARRNVILFSSEPDTGKFRVDTTLSARDDQALAELICATFSCIDCIKGEAEGLKTIDMRITPDSATFEETGPRCRKP